MLILVPTAVERTVLVDALGGSLGPADRFELIGFGPIAAAARAAQLLAERRPTGVLLLGIAGSLSDACRVGRAYQFRQVACHGVGVGSGVDFIPAGRLGWPQWPGDNSGGIGAIGEEIALSGGPAAGQPAGQLLSACAASATADEAAVRRQLFPAAVAEDMEGFAVALACHLAAVPCRIIRGISNQAGDRDPARWQIEPALRAVADLARDTLEETD